MPYEPAPTAPPTEPLPARPALTMQTLFLGPNGLRAGWSLLFATALYSLLLSVAGTLIAKFNPDRPGPHLMTPRTILINEGLIFLCVALVTWIMSRIESRPLRVYGIARRRLPDFFTGLVWGIALLSLLIAALRAFGLIAFRGRLLFGTQAIRYAAIWFVGFLIVGLFEEYAFRGYLQFTLARGLAGIFGWLRAPHPKDLGFWTSALLISFGFGFNHRTNTGESPIGLIAAGLIGVIFCLTLWRTGSLWWAIGFHAAWDWAQSFLYGTADSGTVVEGHLLDTHPIGPTIFSGGLTGPEGSLLVLPILALLTAVVVLTLPARTAEAPPPPTPQLDLP